MGLGFFFLGTMLTGSDIKCGIDNVKAKNYSYRIDEKGRPTWIDRKGRPYINGERVVSKYDYQREELLQVGEKTGRVYFDPEVARLQKMEKTSEDNRQYSLKWGYTSYMKYVPELDKFITCEMSTGKFIAALTRGHDANGQFEYRKFYLDIDAIKPKNPNKFMPSTCAPTQYVFYPMPGDEGIVISKEEFKALNCWFGSHGGRMIKVV